MRIIYLALLLLICGAIYAQNKTLSGFIKDSKSKEALINATIYTNTYRQSTVSDNYGYFSLSAGSDADSLYFSYVGYERKAIAIQALVETTNLNIKLQESTTLEEVKVSAQSLKEEIKTHQLGVNRLIMKSVENMPSVLGEPDILKVLQNMPGVQNGTSGTAGLFVRGTGPGQSLILLDGVPVYNVNHLYGLYSVFNSDAINSATLYKGGFPARYGGRSSAVLDISMREGRNDKIGVKGTIGVVASRLLIEGPIVKDKLTFLISGRRTYADLFINAFSNKQNPDPENKEGYGYYFYDATAKLNYKINGRHKLFMSFYGGKDNLYTSDTRNDENVEYSNKSQLLWGNLTGSLRYNWADKRGGFTNVQVYSSTYKYNEHNENIDYSKETKIYNSFFLDDFNAKIHDIGATASYEKSYGKHRLRFGAGYIRHQFTPSKGEMKRFYGENNSYMPYDTIFTQGTSYLNEINTYVEDQWEISEKVKADYGLRLVMHNVSQKQLEIEPRVQVQYLANDYLSFKTAYTRITQSSFLIATNNFISPADMWVFKTNDMHNIVANQVDFGVSTALWNELKISLETYYKKLDNVLAIMQGTKFDKLHAWNTNIIQGQGKAYGFESLVERRHGKISGWISYTLAYSTRQFDELNLGTPYPYKYDRRHSLSIVGSYQFNKKWSFNAQWNYSSGSWISLYTHEVVSPSYQFDSETNKLESWGYGSSLYSSGKNNHQMPPFHQLDLGFTCTKQKKRALVKWNFGVYNAYNRLNPMYITQKEGNITAHGSLPILPYISYSFSF